jgi:HSP20 family protein
MHIQEEFAMALVRWNPMRDLLPSQSDMFWVQREINRMFDSLWHGDYPESADALRSTWSPSVDLVERDNDYLVKVEVPGIRKDDVKITVQDNVLTIRGEKNQGKEAKDSHYHQIERSYGSFQRSFALPTGFISNKIDATYKDGILSVVLPKAEEAKPKEIEVAVK